MPRATVEAMPGVKLERKHVVPPAVMAYRMQRYSIALMIISFLLIAANVSMVSLPVVLWFASGLAAGFAIMCAVTVIILHAIAWNFDRLRDELRGGRQSQDMK